MGSLSHLKPATGVKLQYALWRFNPSPEHSTQMKNPYVCMEDACSLLIGYYTSAIDCGRPSDIYDLEALAAPVLALECVRNWKSATEEYSA